MLPADPRKMSQLMKTLQSKDFKNLMKEYEKLAKEMQVVLKILEEDAKLYSGLKMEENKITVEEESDRANYYRFMQEVLERLDRIEKRLDEIAGK